MRVNSIAILKTIEISLSNLFLSIAEIPVILCKLRIKKLSNNPTFATKILLQNEYLMHQLHIYRTINSLLCEKLRKRKTKFSFYEKLKIIYYVKKFGIPMRRIKSYLPLSKSTITKWIKDLKKGIFNLFPKSRRPHNPHKTPKGIEELICKIKQDNPTWGYLRICGEILKLGIYKSPNTIKNILKRNGYLPEPDKKEIKENKITTQNPHQLWGIDITTVRIFNLITVYILCIIEDFSRVLLGYSITLKPTSKWVTDVITKVIEKFRLPQNILTDNGPQFISEEFKQFTTTLNITHKRCRPYHFQTNGKIERFFRSLKYELLNYYFLTSLSQLNRLMNQYITYYNYYRPNQGVNNEIPMERLRGKIKKLRIVQNPGKIRKIRFGGILNAYVAKAA